MTVNIFLPDEFLKYFEGSIDELEKSYRVFLAIKLYLEEKISVGKAAELSGLSYHDFEDELKDRNIKKIIGPVTTDKAEKDRENLQKFKKKS